MNKYFLLLLLFANYLSAAHVKVRSLEEAYELFGPCPGAVVHQEEPMLLPASSWKMFGPCPCSLSPQQEKTLLVKKYEKFINKTRVIVKTNIKPPNLKTMYFELLEHIFSDIDLVQKMTNKQFQSICNQLRTSGLHNQDIEYLISCFETLRRTDFEKVRMDFY